MDVKSAAEYIGQTVTIRMESLLIQVRVVNVTFAYGNTRLVVEPVAGSGRQTVDVARVHFPNVEPVR